jgi:hypothetical protein
MKTEESFLKTLDKLAPYFPEMAKNFKELGERLATLESYMAQIRDVINLPPMFPVNPQSGDYFYDDKTGTQWQWHEAEDVYDDSRWYNIDD